MTRQSGLALVLAAALIAAHAIAVLTWDSVWMLAVGALLFALVLVGADGWVSRLRTGSPGPSTTGLVLALAFLGACGIGMVADPQLLAEAMPVLAGGAATPVLRRISCRRGVPTT